MNVQGRNVNLHKCNLHGVGQAEGKRTEKTEWWHIIEERMLGNPLKEKRFLSRVFKQRSTSLVVVLDVGPGLLLQMEGSHRKSVEVCDSTVCAGNSKNVMNGNEWRNLGRLWGGSSEKAGKGVKE